MRNGQPAAPLILLLAVGIWLLVGCNQSAAPQEPPTVIQAPGGYAIEYVPDLCPMEIPAGEEVSCGYLIVPQDRSDPDGPTVELAVAILHSLNPDPAAEPILYLEGGPGGSALLDPTVWYQWPLRDEWDLVLLDQRGTGFSWPSLACPELYAFDAGELDEAVTYLDAVADCRDRLREEGVDLTMYNSAVSAMDVEDLRLALDVPQWNLFGISYGTRLALTILRDYPESVRTVVLDSVYPPDVDAYTVEARTNLDAIQALLDGCAQDAGCDTAFPDLAARFYALVADLNDAPLELDDGELTGDDLIGGLVDLLYATELIPVLPLAIHELELGDPSVWLCLQEQCDWLPVADFGAEEPIDMDGSGMDDEEYELLADAQGLFYAVECHEEAPFADVDQAAILVDQYPAAATDALLDGLFELQDVCSIWGAGTPDPREDDPVVSTTPALLMAGEYDPVTPPDWALLAAASLADHRYVEMPRGGHAVSLLGPCPARIMQEFLIDPATPPAMDCMDALRLPFVLSLE